MDGINTHDILLNCLNWQHSRLSSALGVHPDLTPHPHLHERHQQVTRYMQTALHEIEELMREVQTSSTETPFDK